MSDHSATIDVLTTHLETMANIVLWTERMMNIILWAGFVAGVPLLIFNIVIYLRNRQRSDLQTTACSLLMLCSCSAMQILLPVFEGKDIRIEDFLRWSMIFLALLGALGLVFLKLKFDERAERS